MQLVHHRLLRVASKVQTYFSEHEALALPEGVCVRSCWQGDVIPVGKAGPHHSRKYQNSWYSGDVSVVTLPGLHLSAVPV